MGLVKTNKYIFGDKLFSKGRVPMLDCCLVFVYQGQGTYNILSQFGVDFSCIVS